MRKLFGVAQLPRIAVGLHDLIMVWLCWNLLHIFRYSLSESPPELQLMSGTTALILSIQGFVFWRCGLYRGLWRFASVSDLVNIFRSTFCGAGIILMVLAWSRFEGVPLSVLALYPVVLAAMLGMPRLLYRSWSDYRSMRNDNSAKRVLILGAGVVASAVVRDLRRSGRYHPIGLLDDAEQLKGAKLSGLPVLGTLDALPQIAREAAADMAVIAIAGLDGDGLQRVVALCEKAGLPYRITPTVEEILAGDAARLKEVAIEDLLGRKPVQPDWVVIRKWLGGRKILVTGAGGSIGSELCHQCAQNGVATLVLIEVSELSLMNIEVALKGAFPELNVIAVLGDCGDPAVIKHAMGMAEVDAVFHAAAYKQVPVLEGQLREAVRNNVLATQCVAEAAIAKGVREFVLISTDKAVNPINALGASKRCAEMVCQSLGAQQVGTRFVTVRFGNVLGSAGSVIPLFNKQISAGGPVTVTDPRVTRYFMTIPEACQLILQAVSTSRKAALYTLDMGNPVSILQMAEQMIRLAGKMPGRDIPIVFTGLRPGEKLHETLFYHDEHHVPTAHPKVLEASLKPIPKDVVITALKQMHEHAQRYDQQALAKILAMLVPSFLRTETVSDGECKVVPFVARNGRIGES